MTTKITARLDVVANFADVVPPGVVALCRDASAEISRLQAQAGELQALSVTKIMIDVVPGEDGMGEEIFAKSVDDVESLLSKLGERAAEAETLQAQVDSLAGALERAKRTMADYGQCDNDNWPCFQAVCAALASVGR